MRDGGMNPRLLLVEDDPVSQTYLAEAARALPAEVDCAGSVAEALLLAGQHGYDVWLIDAHMHTSWAVARGVAQDVAQWMQLGLARHSFKPNRPPAQAQPAPAAIKR